MPKSQSRPSIQSPRISLKSHQIFFNFDPKRDAYGFTVRPQHLERYKEYADIYKEEEEERLQKWKSFLEQQVESSQTHLSNKVNIKTVDAEVTKQQADDALGLREEGDDSNGEKTISEVQTASKTEKDVRASDLQKEVPTSIQAKPHVVQTWAEIRPALIVIDHMMSFRVKKRKSMKGVQGTASHTHVPSLQESRPPRGDFEEEYDKEVCENEMVDHSMNASVTVNSASESVSRGPFFPWKEELEFLVRGGVPRDIRGEVWQAFVGVRARRVEQYYQNLLASGFDAGDNQKHDKSLRSEESKGHSGERVDVPERSRKQIEKDLPRTFPGHPAMDENGRNSLRRLLLAYARHNPSVGYCQAMNFFAGLLLLMMPEENAFWALVGIMDDYFDGYFSEEMIESQVDQLVFEELMREKFPKLVNHLDYLGVQVAGISGPWFLSIFVNLLPWESVLRVWDVLLFEGNRVMLFQTALALMELYGPAVGTTKDAGDAITLLQSLTGSTFDSSQLVLTACMGFTTITEERLQSLREKHRPAVLVAVEERSKGVQVLKDPKGLATKLYSFKHDPGSLIKESKSNGGSGNKATDADISLSGPHSANMEELLNGLTIDSEVDSLPDLEDQVVWLKVELCRLLEEKRAAELRAEELETALMEIVKQDNRRELSARIEQLEQEVAELRQALADKKEQENVMLQVLMRVEQEQKVTEDARLCAEQDAAAQRYAVHVLQEKYEKAMAALAQMEKRVVMAESTVEATLQYESGQTKAAPSPRSQDVPTRKTGLLSFGLGWRDRNKGKPSNLVAGGATSESKSAEERPQTSDSKIQTNSRKE